MNFDKIFKIFQGVLIAAFWLIIFLLVLAAVGTAQTPRPTPTSQKGKAPRPVLKQGDPKAKLRRPADPETCLYFVVTSRLDEQTRALVSASVFKELAEQFGDNIIVVLDPSLVPVSTPKQRVHTVNLKITMGRLQDIQADSLPQAIQRDISGPLIAAGKQKVDSKSKIPGLGDAAGRVARQAIRGANVDGQDIVLQYWWTVNTQVDGLPAQDESFFWQVVRHRHDEYANQYCFTAVGLGDSFTTIRPYHNDASNFIGCDFEAVQPKLYEFTLKELWGRPLLSGWLATIPKPPAARTVAQVVAEHEASDKCDVEGYDSTLQRYKCITPKVQTPCLRRRPNADGTFTCLDAPGVGANAGRPRPKQTPAPANTSCGGDPLCGLGGSTPETKQPVAAPAKPEPTPTPVPVPQPAQPAVTSQSLFTQVITYRDGQGNPLTKKMRGPAVGLASRVLANRGYITDWAPDWCRDCYGETMEAGWKKLEAVWVAANVQRKAAGKPLVPVTPDGNIDKAEFELLEQLVAKSPDLLKDPDIWLHPNLPASAPAKKK